MSSSSDESDTVVHHAILSYEYYDDPLFILSSDQPNLQLIGHCFNVSRIPVYVNSSKELWDELLECYGQTNGLEIFQLKKDLHNITQDNLPLIEYYRKLKHAWESIDSLDPILTCSCGLLDFCSCKLLKCMLERDSNNKLIQLLMGLNSGYEGVKITILSMEPLPPINKALALLQKIERQKQIADAVDVLVEASAYAVGKHGHTREECYKLKECTFCGKKGHVREICYCLKNGVSGRPSGNRGRSGFSSGKNTYKRGANTADVLYFKAADLTPLSETMVEAHSSALNMVDASVMDGIVSSVMQQVLKAFSDKTSSLNVNNFAGTLPHSLVNSTQKSVASTSWIMDTGASDHITFNINILCDVHALEHHVLVGLPDGSVKVVHQVGPHHLTSYITLHNVLLVRDFHHNLLSVGKLVHDSQLVAIFDTHTCVLQDPSSKAPKGVAQRHGDLYWFHALNFSHTQNSSFHVKKGSVCSHTLNCTPGCSVAILHARLGHCFSNKMQHVLGHSKSIKQFPCDTCTLSKIHVLPFPRSLSHASTCFALVHMDLWGPYKVPALSGA
ncbi:hypothetical protein RND81_10G065200 [Saponaria officinalis]|uniref:Retrovirus-related Pol polyprotein from transposon TNT 1-94-like beta-barrel domain-containing protein n=1 Tax=Saponaria officinalis TaxID=3572 RepID=A0AAW1HZQ9_SAPOF